MDFSSLSKLVASGFEGGKSVRQLQKSVAGIPAIRGVYLVARKATMPVKFLRRSTGGAFNGRDPTVNVESLRRRWLSKPRVLYVGKAGASNQSTTLRGRLHSFMNFGLRKPCAHWGGRYIWQLSDAKDLLVYWKPTPKQEPVRVESALLSEFIHQYGQLPFANLRR